MRNEETDFFTADLASHWYEMPPTAEGQQEYSLFCQPQNLLNGVHLESLTPAHSPLINLYRPAEPGTNPNRSARMNLIARILKGVGRGAHRCLV